MDGVFDAYLGLDFGTESVRAILVRALRGEERGVFTDTAEDTLKSLTDWHARTSGDSKHPPLSFSASVAYKHGVIEDSIPGYDVKLPVGYALQDPLDWLDAAGEAVEQAAAEAEKAYGSVNIVSIGVAFTSCTVLPCRSDGTPLCCLDSWPLASTEAAPTNPPRADPHCWPKLWKHHSGYVQECADRINAAARARSEEWIRRYGGAVGLEWFLPKCMETFDCSKAAFASAEVFIEGGDWIVWQLTSGRFPHSSTSKLVRSACQAGYKACWAGKDGDSSFGAGIATQEFLVYLNSDFATALRLKLPGEVSSPGCVAGGLTGADHGCLARKYLKESTPVSTAIIDAHAGVLGCGVTEAADLVCVLGTSACHMLNMLPDNVHTLEQAGVAGVVQSGIVPGLLGIETGQSAFGDALGWVTKSCASSHAQLEAASAKVAAGSGGILCLDWHAGCRTPLMDARLGACYLGVTTGTKPEQIYRSTIEGLALGLRRIVELLRKHGAPVDKVTLCGGIVQKNALVTQIIADVLATPVLVVHGNETVAAGAAALGAAALGEQSISEVAQVIARATSKTHTVLPSAAATEYPRLVALYDRLAAPPNVLLQTLVELHRFR